MQLLKVRLGQETYAADVMNVKEVIRLSHVSALPDSPDFVLGVTNIRGNMISVIDANFRFGFGATVITDRTRIVVIDAGNYEFGVLVDDVVDVFDIDPADITDERTVTQQNAMGLIKGVHLQQEQIIFIIDTGKIVSEDYCLERDAA